MIFTEKNKEAVKKFIQIRNRGYYCSGEQVTKVYNEVFGQNKPNTNCSSCLRQRISELEKALKQWEEQEAKEAQKKALEALKEAETNNTQEPLKEAKTAAVKEKKENGSSSTPKTRGRKKK